MVTGGGSTVTARTLVAAACDGDREAFGVLIEPHWAELHAHCYRMLGSVHDADDALQDALLRGWRGLGGFDQERPLRPWLYKIATNACLDAIAKRPVGQQELDSQSVPAHRSDADEPAWVDAYPDEQLGLSEGYASPEARYEQHEAVELAFVAALQQLPALQRATLVLREVLGFSAKEVAEALDTTTASVNSALQRARETLKQQAPETTQRAAIRSLGDRRVREIARRFVDAFEHAEVDLLIDMLAADVTFSLTPPGIRARGRDAVVESYLIPTTPAGALRVIPTTACGQLAFAVYGVEDDDPDRFTPIVFDVVSLHGDRVVAVTAYQDIGIFPRFGLPEALGR